MNDTSGMEVTIIIFITGYFDFILFVASSPLEFMAVQTSIRIRSISDFSQ